MKILIACFLLLLSVQLSAQKQTFDLPKKPIKPRKEPKDKRTENHPPGTVWLKDNLYLDRTEVRNVDYLEYLYWTMRFEPQNLKAALPDTNCWLNLGKGLYGYPGYYLKHPDFQQFPVVGISPAQAENYCKWRSYRVNGLIALRDKQAKISFSEYPDTITPLKYVKYRLPTKDEWEYAAAGGVDTVSFPLGQKDYYLWKKDWWPGAFIGTNPASNTLSPYKVFNQTATIAFTVGVTVGRPNYYGYYNMVGNVQELVADSIVKGASFNHLINGDYYYYKTLGIEPPKGGNNEFHINQSFHYTKPEPYIGFRCIAELTENPTK